MFGIKKQLERIEAKLDDISAKINDITSKLNDVPSNSFSGKNEKDEQVTFSQIMNEWLNGVNGDGI